MRDIRCNLSKSGNAGKVRKYNLLNMAITSVLVVVFLMGCVLKSCQLKTIDAYEEVAYVFNAEEEKEEVARVINIQPEKRENIQKQPDKLELAKDTLGGIPSISVSEKSKYAGQSLFFDTMINMQGTGKEEDCVSPFFLSHYFLNGNLKKEADVQALEQQNIEVQEAQKVEESAKKEEAKPQKPKISLAEDDKNVLLRIVEAEATGEDIRGKMLVANVVLNRVNCKTEFGNTVTDVVFERVNGVYQFSPILDGRYWEVEVTKETRKAVEKVLNGEDDSEGALYFMARKYADPGNVEWFDDSLTWLFSYGEHEFFK